MCRCVCIHTHVNINKIKTHLYFHFLMFTTFDFISVNNQILFQTHQTFCLKLLKLCNTISSKMFLINNFHKLIDVSYCVFTVVLKIII